MIETLIKVSPSRFRVPDVCVCADEPDEQVFSSWPWAPWPATTAGWLSASRRFSRRT